LQFIIFEVHSALRLKAHQSLPTWIVLTNDCKTFFSS
jgi:hypothetical protein